MRVSDQQRRVAMYMILAAAFVAAALFARPLAFYLWVVTILVSSVDLWLELKARPTTSPRLSRQSLAGPLAIGLVIGLGAVVVYFLTRT